ncbi:MAG: WD40 repeat domain-containing protein [Phycisphaerales bacterium]
MVIDSELEQLISRYSDDFVGREWLRSEVEHLLAARDVRIIVIRASPGLGKTAFLAHLATEHPDWPRYFIRRDSHRVFSFGDAKSFLLAIGHQLAMVHPELFVDSDIDLLVDQQVEQVEAGGKLRGVQVDELVASPFTRIALSVRQKAARVAGSVSAVKIGRMRSDVRQLTMEDLQHQALLQPASRIDGGPPITVLVDALDELRARPSAPDVLQAIAQLPALPETLRFVVSSRDYTDLSVLLARDDVHVIDINPADEQHRSDLRLYIERSLSSELVSDRLYDVSLPPETLMHILATQSAGNFLILRTLLAPLIDPESQITPQVYVDDVLDDSWIPGELDDMYRHFIACIVRWSDDRDSGAVRYERLRVVLGVLCVSREELPVRMLAACAGASIEDMLDALHVLRQFLTGQIHADGVTGLYHASFAEYALDPSRNSTMPIERESAHWRIVEYVLERWGGTDSGFERLDPYNLAIDDDYGVTHLFGHLVEIAAEGEQSAVTLSMRYLEAKACRGLLEDAVSELEAIASTTGREAARVVAHVLGREAEFLSRSPASLWQTLRNSCWWYCSSERCESTHQVDPAISQLIESWERESAFLARGGHWLHARRPPRGGYGTGEQKTLLEHSASVTAIAHSRVGSMLASADAGGRVLLRDARTFKQLGEISSQIKIPCIGLAFDSSGRYLVFANSWLDNFFQIIVWDLALERVRGVHSGDGSINAIAVSPAGDRIAFARGDGRLGVWRWATSQRIWGIRAYRGCGASALTWVDDNYLVSGGGYLSVRGDVDQAELSEDWAVKCWAVNARKVVWAFRHVSPVTSVVAHPSGLILSATLEGTIWKLRPEAEHLSSHGRAIRTLAVNSSATRFAVGFTDFYDWSVVASELDGSGSTTHHGHGSDVTSMCFIDDSRVASTSSDCTVRVWDTDSNITRTGSTDHSGEIRGIVLSEESDVAVTSGLAGYAVWTARSGELRRWIASEYSGMKAAFSPDGRKLCMLAEGSVIVIDLETGAEERVSIPNLFMLFGISWSPQGAYIVVTGSVVGHDPHIVVLDTETYAERKRLHGHGRAVWRVRFSDDERFLVSVSDDQTARVWALPDFEEQGCFSGHAGSVRDCQVMSEGRMVASVCGSGRLCFWDPKDSRELWRGEHKYPLVSVELATSGKEVFVSGFSEEEQDRDSYVPAVYAWDIASQTRRLALRGATDIRALGRSDAFLLVSIHDRSFVVDTKSGRVLAELPVKCDHITAFSTGDRWAVSERNNFQVFALQGPEATKTRQLRELFRDREQ